MMRFLKECRSFLLLASRVLRAAPGVVLVAVALTWLTWPHSGVGVLACAGAGVLLRLWAVLRPASFNPVAGFFLGLWWRWRTRRSWESLCESCRIDTPEPPELRRIGVDWPYLRLIVRPSPGQTIRTFEDASEALRLALGAARLRVEPHGHRDLALTLTVGDELRFAFDARPSAASDLSAITVGRTERGTPWRLAIGPHTLIAGSSGAGKGSVFWSVIFGLAHGVRNGLVQLHGIDLKGGMEIRMGDGFFTTSATDARAAVVSLERLVGLMEDRNRAYAGRLRSHQATPENPLHVVMIDELAVLTAYSHDRELMRRSETALNLLCSQGRASGFMVVACLQDPRKEVIPSRGLFTQMVGLRLKDLAETTMVLGETAAETGAHCHRISRDLPGTGYVLPEDGSAPMKVRAGYASDDAIRTFSREFATPQRVPLLVPPADDECWLPGNRRRAKAG